MNKRLILLAIGALALVASACGPPPPGPGPQPETVSGYFQYRILENGFPLESHEGRATYTLTTVSVDPPKVIGTFTPEPGFTGVEGTYELGFLVGPPDFPNTPEIISGVVEAPGDAGTFDFLGTSSTVPAALWQPVVDCSEDGGSILANSVPKPGDTDNVNWAFAICDADLAALLPDGPSSGPGPSGQ